MGISLEFDSEDYEKRRLGSGKEKVDFRAYEGIVFVRQPLDEKCQSMNIYIPEAYFHGGMLNGYTAQTAPVFFPNKVGGYRPAYPSCPGKKRGPGIGAPWDRERHPEPETVIDPADLNAEAMALLKGYVVASPGARGSNLTDTNGEYIGKAPACIVDLKAAVRYLRYNRARIPGDMEKIISNGTSAGGALSALLAATGNHPDFEALLSKAGAVDGRDDIFGASCYCPITNLENADSAYEWMFQSVNEYVMRKMGRPSGMPAGWGQMPHEGTGRPNGPIGQDGLRRPGNPGGLENRPKTEMTASQKALSEKLKKRFPEYVNQLGLKDASDNLLTLQEDGTGPFLNYLSGFIKESAMDAISGMDNAQAQIPDFLAVEDGIVYDIDFEGFVNSVGRLKAPGAFDGTDGQTMENQLFGDRVNECMHFSDSANQEPGYVQLRTADPETVRRMNPMNYIASKWSDVSGHWRVRHGSADSDTSLAIPVILVTKLRNEDIEVDFAVPWGRGHGGDYDLGELFEWTEQICRTQK